MANITVKVPDDVYRRAKVHAAQQDTSVSALVASYLAGLGGARHDDLVRELEALYEEIDARPRESGPAAWMTRDEAHDRAAARAAMTAVEAGDAVR